MTAGPAVEGDGSMGRALAAGLPEDLLAVLMAARVRWRAGNEGRALYDPPGLPADELWRAELDRALAHPAAGAFDEVFVAAMRRATGGQQ